ncbi:MAG: hypothetical protein CSA05_00300 [Bacteroidia bacterium]|nr:MAG: hypothetical protein CSB01_01190 [Bacteroidia bacterium]PIE86505.1 MAG: hypothetical protein CSA05_00300 [Bacteroidia bacterium]
MNKFFVFLLAILSWGNFLFAQEVTIKGNAPQYSGEELFFYYYSDRITMDERQLTSCIVENDGSFKTSFYIDEIMSLHIYLGVFQGFLYVEPDSTYEILLPPKQEKQKSQKLNPFFEYHQVYLKILNQPENELNEQIGRFDKHYAKYLSENALAIYAKRQLANPDSFQAVINDTFEKNKHPFFQQYKNYRLAYINHFAKERNPLKVFQKYYDSKPILHRNPAYMKLLGELCSKYLENAFKTPKGDELLNTLLKGDDIFSLKQQLSKATAIKSDTLLEIILLQTLYSGYYNKDFSRKTVLNNINLIKQYSTITAHIDLAENIEHQISYLQNGTLAPPFELENTKGKKVRLSDFRGKYVYLNFVTTDSYACKTDLELLKKLYQKQKKIAEFVTVSVDEDFAETKKFIERNNYKWTFLKYTRSSDLLKKYRVYAYPVYYLIDPDGRLAMSPSVSPREDFELRFFEIWTAWKQQKRREEHQRKR